MIAQRGSRKLFVLAGVAVGVVSLALIAAVWRWRAPAVARWPQVPASLANHRPSHHAPRKLPDPAKRVEGPNGRIAAVNLAWQSPTGSGLVDRIKGILPVGRDTDVVWTDNQLFLLKKKGHLEPAWLANVNESFLTPESGGTPVCYDGQYVWASLVRHRRAPLLIVLDPQTGKTWAFGPEDGLPVDPANDQPPGSGDSYLVVGPIGPGKACLAYSAATPHLPPAVPGGAAQVRREAARLAIAEFTPSEGASFHVFLPPEPSTTGAASPQDVPRLDHPVALLSLSATGEADGKPARRLAMIRSMRSFNEAPLLIDPETLSHEFASNNAAAAPVNNSRIASLNGALYWLSQTFEPSSKFLLTRAALPKLDEEFVLADMPEGNPVAYRDGLAFLGEKCWFWKHGGQTLEVINVQVPWSFSASMQRPRPSEISTGEEWELRDVFASQAYGVLATAIKKTGANRYAETYRFFQFVLADDPRIAPDSPPPVEKPTLAIDVPPGTAASELSVFAGDANEAAPAVCSGAIVEAGTDQNLRYPILAREVVRQALLIAARDQLQWDTRDQILGEDPQREAEPTSKFVISMRFPHTGASEFDLRRIDGPDDAAAVWKEQLVLNQQHDEPLDYGRLIEAAERWSREAFPTLLTGQKLSGEPVASSNDTPLSAAAADWLKQMAFTAQFVVARDLHRAIRRQGESDELLAALARAYANLGVLSEFHWNSVHKALKARSLLYAQRYVARSPQSCDALWSRAYAKGMAGLHDAAIADLESAEKLRAAQTDAEPRPPWVDIIGAYCRFETEKLAEFAEQKDYAPLAALLQFFHLESLKESVSVQTLARRFLEENPEDFRLYDAMCDSCAIDTLHVVTQLAPAVLNDTVAARLGQLSALPAATTELLHRPADNPANLAGLVESLLAAPGADDPGELSWRLLGRLLQETEFIQLWRRVYFMRFQWAVPADDFIAAVEGVASAHRYRPLIDACSLDTARAQAAAQSLSTRLSLEELEYSQLRAFQHTLRQLWQIHSPDQYAQAEQRAALHTDDVHRDLLARLEYEQWHAVGNLASRLNRVSSRSPDAIAATIRHNHSIEAGTLAALEPKFAASAQFWKVVAENSHTADQRQKALRRYIDLSPDVWAYRQLAEQFRKEGKIDQWKATLDECLQQPDFGLEHAGLRVSIANYLMDQDQWEQARPYADAAAETWAEWAMLCAVRCYQGLGDEKQEGVWRARVAERYPKVRHSLDYYVWARRTGQAKAEQLPPALGPQIAAAAETTEPKSQHIIGLFYQLSKRPQPALAAYQKGAADHRDPRVACFNGLWAAALAQELGNPAVRDAALQQITKLAGTQAASYRELSQWLQRLVADGGRSNDLDQAGKIVDNAARNDRAAVCCVIARFLELSERTDDALAFYWKAVAEPAPRFAASYALACAALRDRGFDPHQGPAATKSDAKGDAP